jgi:predicted RNA-binding protein with PIN domain
MPVLVDGNNLLHRLPQPKRNREQVRRLVLDHCRHERVKITVVFDGPPPAGAPPREKLGAATVVYAGPETADDVIIRHLPGGAASRDWVVVSDDRELQSRARDRGASTRTLAEWSRKKPPPPPKPRIESKLSSREVEEWETFFAGETRDDEDSRE